MIPDRDDDHVGQGLGLLLTQYQNKPRFEALAKAYLRQVQLLEDAIYDVLIQRLIDQAVGVQVDVIGKIVGEVRFGRSDAEYKLFIKARIRINRSRGNTSDVLAILAMVTTTPVIFREYVPCALSFEMSTIPDHDPVLIYRMMRDAKAAGVKLTMIVPTTNTEQFMPMDYAGSSDPLHALGDANASAATFDGEANQPFALSDGDTLILSYDGETPITFTFKAADFVAIGAATAAEIVAVLNRARRRHGIATVDAATIRLTSYTKGTTSSVQVTGGTVRTLLGFDGAIRYGSGDTTFGLLSDAVTIRDPMAVPIDPIPGPPTVLYVDPGYET